MDKSNANMFYIESTNINAKFFCNSLFCSSLQEYLSKEYNVSCQIPTDFEIDDENGILIEFSGSETAVKNARDRVQTLFETMKTKLYNDETTDRKGKKIQL